VDLEPFAYDVWHDRAVFHSSHVVRYDAKSLHQEFGVRFCLLDSCKEMHNTPFGTDQQFLYCLCRIE